MYFPQNEPWLITLEGYSQLSDKCKELVAVPQAQWPTSPDLVQTEPALAEQSPIVVVRMHGTMLLGLSLRTRAILAYYDIPIIETAEVAQELYRLAGDERVKVVVLDINSPGGRVTGTPELAAAVKKLCVKKYVYAFTADMACSAAYWVASQCDGIYAAPSAQLGSIGVILPLLDSRLKLEKAGITIDVISAGKYKSAGTPCTTLSEEQRELLQNNVNDNWEVFKQAVTRRRNIAAESMEGQSFTGEKAISLGLVDANINSLPQLLDKLMRRHRL